MTIAEKITRAKTDYDEVYHAGKLAVLKSSEVLHGTASGEAIAVHDVSPVEHNVGVKLTSKNLYAPTLQNFNGNGITAVKNNDNTYTINGTASEEIYIHVGEALPCEEGKTYYFSGGTANIFVAYQLRNNGSSVKSITVNDRVQSDNATNWNEVNVVIEIPKGTVADNVIIKPMISLFDNTPYTPYVADLTGVEVSRYGKNLCSNVYEEYTTISDYSSFFVANEPLKMSFKDKDTSVDVSDCYIGFAVNPANINEGFRWAVSKGTISKVTTNDATKDATLLCPYIIVYPKTEEAFDKIMQRWDVQVELNPTATEYEPYKEPQTAKANAEGVVKGLTSLSPNMTLMTDTEGVMIDLEYYKDIDLAFENLTTEIALSGGE